MAEGLSGHQILKEAAQQNVLQWKFERRAREAPTNSLTLKYMFLLEGEPQDRTKTTFVFELPNNIQIATAPARAISNR